jgi:hypothetical protein
MNNVSLHPWFFQYTTGTRVSLGLCTIELASEATLAESGSRCASRGITGIALIRSRAIPLWAALLFIVGIPFQAAGYGTHVSILQLICFALIFLGSIPAALAILKLRDEQAR